MKLIIHDPVIQPLEILVTYHHGAVEYTHNFVLPATAQPFDSTTRRLVRWLAVVHACYLFSFSYFTEIQTEFPLTPTERAFFEQVVFDGMAEFRYVNAIALDTKTTIVSPPAGGPESSTPVKHLSGRMLLNGGGKDGIVSSILLSQAGLDFDLFQVGTSSAQSRVAKKMTKQPIVFKRLLDKRWLHDGQYKGHRPTSAAIAIAAVLTAYLLGKKDVIASNESSANEATVTIDEVVVNHQYSKSYEFEYDLTQLLSEFKVGVRYFSLLRPLHELQIVIILSQYPEFWGEFVSCNHGFRRGVWCRNCAKCAFISLALTAISPTMADQAIGVPEPLQLPELFDHIVTLVNPDLEKPLECVGTLLECQVAAKLVSSRPDVGLSQELAQLFNDTSGHITSSTIATMTSQLNTEHSIPTPEYSDVMVNIRTYLDQTQGDVS